MKIVDCLTEIPDSGPCSVDLEKLVKCFGNRSTISKWHDEYRLCNHRAGIKVSIKSEDALELIQRLSLVEVKSPIFVYGSTFMTIDRAVLVREQAKIPDLVLDLSIQASNLAVNLTPVEKADFYKRAAKSFRSFAKTCKI